MLDLNTIANGFSVKNALIMARFSALAYTSPDEITETCKREGWPDVLILDGVRGANGFVASNDTDAVLVFRGTANLRDILTDLGIELVEWWETGQVHAGFRDDFAPLWSKFRDRLLPICFKRKVWVTGHSLGAALATLTAAALSGYWVTPQVYTFGSPRVGDKAFAKDYNETIPKTYRVVNRNDAVTLVPVPGPLFPYRHVGQAVHIPLPPKTKEKFYRLAAFLRDEKELLDGEALEDHHIANYVASLQALTVRYPPEG